MAEPTKLYVWDDHSDIGGNYDTESEAVGEANRGPAPRCPACNRVLGPYPWLPPYRIRLIARGRAGIGDVAYDVSNNYFVSRRFRAGFNEFGLQGLVFSPAEVIALKGKKRFRELTPPQVFHTAANRGHAAIDVARSELKFGPVECNVCRSMRQVASASRIAIEPGTWDGLDVFIPRGLPGTVLVTDRFEEMRRQYGITNITLIPAEEYSFNSMPWLNG